MGPIGALGLNELIFRLTIAVIIGSLLGLNRELHGKAAGLRTHALVALGAAIVAILAVQVENNVIGVDPNALSRIIQGTLTGIGFLGAGVILRGTDEHVSGLTTAATIWICAVIGLICGLAYWELVGVATSLVLTVLVFGPIVERIGLRIFKKRLKPPTKDDA